MVPPPPTPSQPFAPPRRDFIGKPAPDGYVAGIGRGATGFTTRSDIGPAREATFAKPDDSDVAGPSKVSNKRPNDANNEEEEDLNESNYDEFAGYGGSLFSRDPYEEDDEEADKIYAEIDKHIDERGKALREARARQELEVFRKKRPKIQQQFSDLKADLRHVTEQEWMSVPEPGDDRNRKQRVARQDKFTPVPDSLLAHQAKLAAGGDKLVYLDPKATRQGDSDEEYESEEVDVAALDKRPLADMPMADGQGMNIGDMSEFRSSYMRMKLSGASGGSSDASRVATNAHDYLTNLESMMPNQITDNATLTEFRKLFASLRAANPKFQNAWIASVRLEEVAGKLKTARTLILTACEQCPKSADLWLEAIRLHPSDISKPLIVKALKELPRCEKLWIKAAELEVSEESRRNVLTKARQLVPKSVTIWKKSIELEQPDQAKVLLKEAVECCPNAVELWIALSKLSPYEEANQILKEANEKNPRDRSVWITAAKLQEQVGKTDLVEKIVQLSVSDLAEKGADIKRNEWLQEAVDADKANFKVTCHEIIKRIIGWNISEPDKLNTWLQDAKTFVACNSIDCARSVFKSIVCDKNFERLESVWREYYEFEQKHGTKQTVIEALLQAVKPQHCHKSEWLWLKLAQERRSNLLECRQTLSEAVQAIPDSEKIVLEAVELECENGNHDVARQILAQACTSAKTAQLVMRSAKLEWSLGNLDDALRALHAGVDEYKNRPEFYLTLGQIEEQKGDIEQAKNWFSSGLKFNPTSVPLWISVARLEEKSGAIARARSRLEMARLRNPKNVQLWLESAQLEWRQFVSKSGAATHRARPDMVTTILAKGIKECRERPDVDKLLEFQSDIAKRKFG